MKQGFDYGPFTQGDKVLVYHESNDEWYIGTVQEQDGDSVLIADESGLLHCGYYDEVPVSECFPINHSDIAKDVAEYERLFERMAKLDEAILSKLKKKYSE